MCYTTPIAMILPSLPQLVPILQLAVGPVILISGVGLLQLSLTNRLGRLIDRARLLSRERAAAAPADRARGDAQLARIDRRAHILRRSITLIGSNIYFIGEMNVSHDAVHLEIRRE